MQNENTDNLIRKTIMASRMIVGALIAGCLIFGGIACVIVSFKNQQQPADMLIPAIMGGVSLFSFISVNIVQATRNSSMGTPQTTEQACQHYQTSTLIWNAGLEGPCFVNIVGYIVSGVWWSMALAGVFVAIMLITFPNETALKHYLESNLSE